MKIVELSSTALPAPFLSEREVLIWMAKGKSNTDVAAILSISPETIATYKRRIYGKLDVTTGSVRSRR
jgi:DNA-binding NarL/FixJ family response regulator